MDNLTKDQRKLNMSRIRSSGTKLEENFFKLLEENKIPHTKHPKIFGKPDCQIGDNLLIFVDSDFWHGWNFNRWRERLPKTYWVEKIENNIKRDRRKFRVLKKHGYTIVRIWGHDFKKVDK
ncbi:very short patch repair endonuclease, partial [Candidatus Gottesmanbacteria bacterium]|nr:very short patch repair endonuclease [Candidatus Gottesmanbacteria bacterium]